jgi:hypothetical protein
VCQRGHTCSGVANPLSQGKSLLFPDERKPVGAGAVSQPLMPTGERSGFADAHRDDGKRFIVRADDKLSAFLELERQVLTVTFYLASIHAGDQ